MNNWIVAKFGGSSVKDGGAMLRCASIIENNPNIKVTIISATYNTTNQLEEIAKASKGGDENHLALVLKNLEEKHNGIANELYSSKEVHDELQFLYQEIRVISDHIKTTKNYSDKVMDQLYSLGERMSSLIFADLLRLRIPDRNVKFVDARKIIKTNSEFRKAEPQIDLISEETEKILIPILNEHKTIVVTQGFIGSDLFGQTTTLGREGSDYSAALIGEAINADLIQIWTDVEGVASSDPRHVEKTYFIDQLSYDEATSLASLGAKVLFKRTLLPAKRKNIPVFVGSSLNPKAHGTIINSNVDKDFKIKAVTSQVAEQGPVLSFVGTHLDKNQKTIEELQCSLKKAHPSFELIDLTSSYVCFKFSEISEVEAMRLGHKALLQL